MSLPYPPPAPIKTTKRCKFNLPGMHYNCRAVGRFVLGEKGFCAPHYDTVWKVQNPIYGQQHDWRIYRDNKYETCRRCGDIKPHDGLPLSPCGGVMPKIELR